MNTNQPFENYADAYHTLHEMGASINPYVFSHRLCISYRLDTLSIYEFEMISKHLVSMMEKIYIETPIEF
jgi:hypothetical protein